MFDRGMGLVLVVVELVTMHSDTPPIHLPPLVRHSDLQLVVSMVKFSKLRCLL